MAGCFPEYVEHEGLAAVVGGFALWDVEELLEVWRDLGWVSLAILGLFVLVLGGVR